VPTDFVTALAMFTSPHDVNQLQTLEAATRVCQAKLTGEEFRAVFDLFERFPDEDGYGIFWSLVHAVEAAGGYEAALLESVGRKPVEFNVMMIGRLLNAGVLECSGQNLEVLLKLVAAREGISAEARLTAQNLLSNGRRREA